MIYSNNDNDYQRYPNLFQTSIEENYDIFNQRKNYLPTINNETNNNNSISNNEESRNDADHIKNNIEKNRKITENCINIQNNINNDGKSLLKIKRKNISNQNINIITKHHSKFGYDNLKRKCKHLVIENLMKFINNKIYLSYKGNIGCGLLKKELVKLNQKQKKDSNAIFNKLMLKKSIRDILSQNITTKIKYYNLDHNKKVIDEILNEKKEDFESLFNISFIDCLEHFAEVKEIKELNGLTLFSELKSEIIKKHEKDGELYYENIRLFLKDYKNKINNEKPRKSKKNKEQKI